MAWNAHIPSRYTGHDNANAADFYRANGLPLDREGESGMLSNSYRRGVPELPRQDRKSTRLNSSHRT